MALNNSQDAIEQDWAAAGRGERRRAAANGGV